MREPFLTVRGTPVPPVPAPWPPPSQQREPSRPARSSKVVGTIVSHVATTAGYLGVPYLMGPNLSLPDSVAGPEPLTDPESKRSENYTADDRIVVGLSNDLRETRRLLWTAHDTVMS
jgi:hypothetical protein